MREGASARPAWPRWPAALAWVLWALTMLGLAVLPWLDRLLRQASRPDLTPLTSDAVALVLGVVSAATVGAVLASRRPRHPVGWLLLTLGLSLAAAGAATGYANYGLLARPGALPAIAYAALYHGVNILFVAACLGFVLLLTPTGSLPSARWRWWARVAVAAPLLAVGSSALLPFDPPYQSVVNPLAVSQLAGPLRVVNFVTWPITGLAIVVAAWSLVVRFRRARGVERQQLRWLALAAGLTGAVLLALVALVPTGNELLLGWLSAVCVALLPLATGAAILRYRLYDLDRIISRTLAYGLLTAVLGLCYVAGSLVFVLVAGVGSDPPSWLVAASTLAAAAVFRPARRGIQTVVDRRFNRRRYDAAQTIQAFSARLRQQVDLDTLTAELLAVVEETMQPTRVSIWLTPAARGKEP
jgi:hypothetical protein